MITADWMTANQYKVIASAKISLQVRSVLSTASIISAEFRFDFWVKVLNGVYFRLIFWYISIFPLISLRMFAPGAL